MVVVKISLGNGNDREDIIVCSAYLPFDSPRPPPSEEIMRLVEYCQRRRLPLILGCDANAHHTQWGSTGTNARGESLLEYLYTTDLTILNRGNEPTFVTSRRQEVLDLTLCSYAIENRISKWKVSQEPSLSDHRHILFCLNDSQLKIERYRNPRSTDWESYNRDLVCKMEVAPKQPKTKGEIERNVAFLQKAITSAYEDNCPLRECKSSGKCPWWNSELQKLRTRVRKLQNKAKRTKLTEDWEAHKEAQRQYKYAIRRSQRESWRSFCENIEDLPTAARLSKVLSRNKAARLDVLRLPNDSYTESDKETLEHLIDVHFPGSVNIVQSPQLTPHTVNAVDWVTAAQVVTHDRLRWAIFTFEPFKSSGPDGIFPALLQKGVEILTPVLCHILRSSLALGYIPYPWREVKVAFIPKPGRRSYDSAKAFRPISLSSFLLKTGERLVERFIKDGALTQMPLHLNQHAYQAGKSTETALHNIVYRIEKTFQDKEYALAAFLDVEGAFDNTSFESICSAALQRGVHPTIVVWIRQMLEGRSIEVTLRDSSLRAKVGRGCPQGGVLSPLLWCLVLDGLLVRLNERGLYTQAYADDIVILIRGKSKITISEVMQNALNIVEGWCREQELSVNPNKAEVVLFTKKRNVEGLNQLTLQNTQIHIVSQAKYLGVILDSKLNWRQHVVTQTQKACTSMWMCKNAIGAGWGLKPKVVYWLYTMVIRPKITYAAVIWWPALEVATNRILITKIQRLACISITGAMRTTPTAAMEALLGLPPLQIFVEREARSAVQRLREGKQWVDTRIMLGHSKILNRPGWENIPGPTDFMGPRFNF